MPPKKKAASATTAVKPKTAATRTKRTAATETEPKPRATWTKKDPEPVEIPEGL